MKAIKRRFFIGLAALTVLLTLSCSQSKEKPAPDVMEFLSSIRFNLMSLANNHAWDLGDCGVKATITSADAYSVTHAGTGTSVEEAVSPVYLTVRG